MYVCVCVRENHKDDIYHCTDPLVNNNNNDNDNANGFITCNPTTYLWNIQELNPLKKPDETDLCQELVGILVRSKQQETLNQGQLQSTTTSNKNQKDDIEVWESMMEHSVVDELEPCVLWALTYGPLRTSSSSMAASSSSGGGTSSESSIQQQQQEVEVQEEGKKELKEEDDEAENE